METTGEASMHAEHNEYLTIPEVAAVLRVSPVTVWRWCHQGELPAVRLGRTWRIPRAALEARLTVPWPGPGETGP